MFVSVIQNNEILIKIYITIERRDFTHFFEYFLTFSIQK